MAEVSALSTTDRIALQDVMLNYAAGVDERDKARYAACFASELEIHNFGDAVFRGRDEWVDYVWSALSQYSATQHLLGPQFATAASHSKTGNRCASTRSDVQAMHVLVDGGRFTLWATYHTTLECIDSQWLITRHELQVRGSSSATD
ncbi:MAG: nuclear transport factor 2 family protein [Halioglobus sp.]